MFLWNKLFTAELNNAVSSTPMESSSTEMIINQNIAIIESITDTQTLVIPEAVAATTNTTDNNSCEIKSEVISEEEVNPFIPTKVHTQELIINSEVVINSNTKIQFLTENMSFKDLLDISDWVTQKVKMINNCKLILSLAVNDNILNQTKKEVFKNIKEALDMIVEVDVYSDTTIDKIDVAAALFNYVTCDHIFNTFISEHPKFQEALICKINDLINEIEDKKYPTSRQKKFLENLLEYKQRTASNISSIDD